MHIRSKYYHNILISYVLAVFLPVILLCILIYHIGIVRLREEMVRSQRILLSQASGIMTKRLDECVNVAKRISLDKNILRLSSDLKEYEIFEGIKNMAKHVETNSFFSNIIIKKNNDNTLYTSEGTVFENVLLTRKYRFTQEEYEIFNKCISDGVECLYYFNNAQITMQFIPIPVLSRNPNGCLIFVIEKQSLMGIFSDEQQFNYNTTFLVNEYQQPIFILDNSNVISSEEMFTAVLSAHGNDSFRFDKKNYTLIEEDIKGAGWRLVSIIPDEWLQQRMKSAYLVIWIVAILLISALLVFLFSRRQYNPIKALSQIVGNNTSVNNTSYDNRKTMNELQNISYALSASKALGEQAKIQSRLLRQNLILRLLDCDIKDIKELNEIFKALGMFKEKAMYSVISIRIKDKLVNFDYDNLLHYIDQKYSTYDMAYSVKVAAQEVIAVIVKLNDNVQYALEYIIDDIKNYLSENIGFQTDFGIGRPYPLERSSISYLESIAALEHLSQNGIEHVAYFNDIQFAPIMDIEFRKKIRQYLHCLQQPDRKTAYTLLDEIMAILYKQTSKQIQMYFRYKLIEPVFHMLADENISNRLRKEHETNITSFFISALSINTTLDELKTQFRFITDIMCDITEENLVGEESDKYQVVKEWLNDHIYDPLLSLEMLADALGYSTPYWSRFFSEKMQISFNEYVWQLRKEKAKEMLKRTSKSVKEIVMEVGYIDVSSFTRRFKHEEGVTPGQYKKLLATVLKEV